MAIDVLAHRLLRDGRRRVAEELLRLRHEGIQLFEGGLVPGLLQMLPGGHK